MSFSCKFFLLLPLVVALSSLYHAMPRHAMPSWRRSTPYHPAPRCHSTLCSIWMAGTWTPCHLIWLDDAQCGREVKSHEKLAKLRHQMSDKMLSRWWSGRRSNSFNLLSVDLIILGPFVSRWKFVLLWHETQLGQAALLTCSFEEGAC